MRTLLPFLLAASMAASSPSGAAEFVVTGNDSLPLDAIIDAAHGACSGADSICVGAMCRAVAQRYWDNGYLDAGVTCDRLGPDSDTVSISIREGTLSRLRSVGIEGSRAFDADRLESVFDEDLGQPFSKARLERGIGSLLAFYDQQGFPAAGIQPETVTRGDGWVGVILRIEEGRRARVGRVSFNGLRGTRRDIILAESGISEGAAYDGERVARARERLMGLGVFESVSEPILSYGAGDTLVAVTFEVLEAKHNRVEGLIAYAPSQEEGKVVGSLDLELGNIAGTLRRLRVQYNRPGPGRLRWGVAYREPRLGGMPVALEAMVSSDVIESSFARRRLSAGFTYTGKTRLEAGLGGVLGVTKDRSAEQGEGDFSERGVSFALSYEGRDRPLNPLSGGFVAISGEVSALDFDSQEVLDRTLAGLESKAGYVVEVADRTVVAAASRFQGAFVSSGAIPTSHLIRLGGAGSLRGYPEEWFSVEKALVLTFEVRRVLGASSRIYAFVDGATIEDTSHRFGDLEGNPFGYGFGFTGGARGGVFRLEIAMGRDDGFSDAKLHLGLVQRF